MRARVQKWGNSLGLRIPKPFAEETRLIENGEVELTVVRGKLVVEAVEPSLTLAALLAEITDDNIHLEIDSDGPVGREAW